MASRRAMRILLVIGVVLIAVGLFAIFYGNTPASVSETDAIPAGWQNFNEFPWPVLNGGTIQGTFQALNGTPVQVLVYNDAAYGAYVNGANDSSAAMYNVTALNGSFSLTLSGFNTYHIVFQHGAGYENVDQFVLVTLTATGSDPTFTIGGILALMIAVALIVLSVRRLRTPAGPAGTLPSRATIGMPPTAPTGPDTSTTGAGMYRVPPPLPGDPSSPPPAVSLGSPPGPSSPTSNPIGTVIVTLQNPSAADTTVDLVVNGVAVTSLTVGAGQSQQTSVSARLSSPFGSTVTVEAMMAGGRRVRQAVFVGAGGTAPVSLRIG